MLGSRCIVGARILLTRELKRVMTEGFLKRNLVIQSQVRWFSGWLDDRWL